MKKKQDLVGDISEKLCSEFQIAVPLHQNKLERGKKLSNRDVKANSEAALIQFYKTANQERLRHRLGVVGRARVALGLQQRLLKAGYDASLVKEVLWAMLISAFVGNQR